MFAQLNDNILLLKCASVMANDSDQSLVEINQSLRQNTWPISQEQSVVYRILSSDYELEFSVSSRMAHCAST